MDYTDRTGTTRSSATENVSRAWQTTKDRSEDVLDSGETCVRDHPGSAVLTAFLGGLFIGCFVGWSFYESREHQHRNALRNVVRDLQRRLQF
jgi:hypothetical protein